MKKVLCIAALIFLICAVAVGGEVAKDVKGAVGATVNVGVDAIVAGGNIAKAGVDVTKNAAKAGVNASKAGVKATLGTAKKGAEATRNVLRRFNPNKPPVVILEEVKDFPTPAHPQGPPPPPRRPEPPQYRHAPPRPYYYGYPYPYYRPPVIVTPYAPAPPPRYIYGPYMYRGFEFGDHDFRFGFWW